jgi:thioredoxin 1
MNSLTSKNVSELAGEIPIVVKVTAEWCGPCRNLAPTVKELEKEYENKIKFLSLDTDREQELCTIFKISSIPTLLFVKAGRATERLIGVKSKREIIEKIEEMLK